MTTAKHVVDDDVFGELTRRIWELQRRVLEGSLDPNTTIARLQFLIQGESPQKPLVFATELSAMIEKYVRSGGRQKILVALAEALQRELCIHPGHRNWQKVPYAGPLENIMRAVIAALNMGSREDQGGYISDKLRGGVCALADQLKDDSRRFVENETQYKWELTEVHTTKI